jgi:agmatine deiminase
MQNKIEKLPKDLGFYMPAEWQRHDRCWMLWPTGIDPVRYPNVDKMRQAYAKTANAIVEFEPVTMITNELDVEECQKLCGKNVEIMPMQIDDSWARDSGPTFITKGRSIAGVDWTFNNYGENLDLSYKNDALIASKVTKYLNLHCFDAPIVLEGGAIHTDGNGTLMITEDVLFDPKRNPGLTKQEAELILSKYLGVENFIWLIAALEFDDTGGHIDNLACFTPYNQILALSETDPEDSNYDRLKENRNRLNYAKNINGKHFDIVEIHQPAYREFLKERMPLSYINFYIANQSIIMPVFNDSRDKKAIETINNIFQDRIVIPIEGLSIVEGGGGIHCITQQQPATN